MLVALYKGHSAISRAIIWIAGKPYSHAANVCRQSGTTWEAWHNPGRFRELPTPWTMHSPGTEIDFFEVEGMTLDIAASIRATCTTWARLGVRYDYIGCTRFVTRIPRREAIEDRLFCSEAVALSFLWAGLPLLNADPSLISPSHLAWSPRLKRLATRPEWVPPNPT